MNKQTAIADVELRSWGSVNLQSIDAMFARMLAERYLRDRQ